MEKVFITGTGRCGTTFLMRLLTFLGEDTGFTKENMEIYVYKNCNSGLEKPDCVLQSIAEGDFEEPTPFIIKSPRFCTIMDELHKKYDIRMVVIPVRNLEECAKSRQKYGKGANGGFPPGITDIREMKVLQERRLGKLVEDVTVLEIPHTFISFPRMIKDIRYLYDKLKCILQKDTDFPKFEKAYVSARECEI